MALRGVNSALCTLAASLIAAGCFLAPGRTVHEIPPGEWPQPLGGGERAPFVAESAPEAPVVEWRRGVERGVQHAPVVQGNLLIMPTTGRALTVVSAVDGHRYWTRRFNGPVVGGALRRGERVFIGTASRDGSVYAFSIARGRKHWQTKLRSPVAGEPILVGDRMIVASLRGELSALDIADGDVLWRTRIPGPPLGAPVEHDGAIVLATARDTLVRIDVRDGRVLATQVLTGTPTAAMARAGDQLVVPVHPGVLARFSLPALLPVRNDSLDDLVLAAPAVDTDGSTYALTRSATVWRVDATGARRIATLGGTARESFTLARNGLLVGRLDGTLFLLRRDGTEVWQKRFERSLRAPVALAGGAAFVTLLNGDLVKLK